MIATCLMLGFSACGHRPPAVANRPRCPAGSEEQPQRTVQVQSLLMTHQESAQAIPLSLSLCYQAGRGRGVISNALVMLDSLYSDRELSAQLAHLVVHFRDGLGTGCAAGRQLAERSEERALAAERRVRQALNAPAPLAVGVSHRDYQARCVAP